MVWSYCITLLINLLVTSLPTFNPFFDYTFLNGFFRLNIHPWEAPKNYTFDSTRSFIPLLSMVRIKDALFTSDGPPPSIIRLCFRYHSLYILFMLCDTHVYMNDEF